MQRAKGANLITVRNIPPKLARTIRQKAAERRSSINRTVIHLLEESLGMGEKQAARGLYRDLDELAGAWSPQEAAEFEEALALQRGIDPDVWK